MLLGWSISFRLKVSNCVFLCDIDIQMYADDAVIYVQAARQAQSDHEVPGLAPGSRRGTSGSFSLKVGPIISRLVFVLVVSD